MTEEADMLKDAYKEAVYEFSIPSEGKSTGIKFPPEGEDQSPSERLSESDARDLIKRVTDSDFILRSQMSELKRYIEGMRRRGE
jgi:hypothetical protein